MTLESRGQVSKAWIGRASKLHEDSSFGVSVDSDGPGYKILKTLWTTVKGCEKQDQTEATYSKLGKSCEGSRHENEEATQETTAMGITAQEYLELRMSLGYLTRPHLTYPRSGVTAQQQSVAMHA